MLQVSLRPTVIGKPSTYLPIIGTLIKLLDRERGKPLIGGDE